MSQLLTDDVRAHIAVVARRMVGCGGLLPGDVEDLEQELCLAVLRAEKAYDPTKSTITTFTNRVIDNARKMILRSQRNHRCDRFVSLNLPVGSKEGDLEAVDLLVSESPSAPEVLSARELPEWTYRLSPLHRKICRWLLRGESKRCIARRLHISPDTLYRELRSLRERVRDTIRN